MTDPVQAVRLPNPYVYYAELVERRPFAFEPELRLWAAADAATVTEVLEHPGLRVRPADQPVPPGIAGTPAGEVFGSLVRMTDGRLQQRLKGAIVETLGAVEPARVAEFAAARARARLSEGGPAPLEALMFSVPAEVVAALCGLDPNAGEQAARLAGEFVRCLPASAGPEDHRSAAQAAAGLLELLGPRFDAPDAGLLGDLVSAASRHGWTETAPLLANAVGFLSQTYEATAGLIGNTLMAFRRGAAERVPAGRLSAVVREVARYDAPVQNTRRFAAAEVTIGGRPVQAGAAILVVLAAANRDPAVNPDPERFLTDRRKPAVFTFGLGAHACPGERLATAIAAAVVGELLDVGFDPAGLPEEPGYRPSPNARIPVLTDPAPADPTPTDPTIAA